jgi:hypothetical protein
MSDVQAGGATVFPYLGLKIFPEKVCTYELNFLREY